MHEKFLSRLLYAFFCRDSNDQNEKAFSWKTLTSRPVLCPLGIGLVVLALQQFSGIDSVVFYTVDIFRSSGKLSILQQQKLYDSLSFV